MRKMSALIVVAVLGVVAYWKSGTDYYEYALQDREGAEVIVLRVPKISVIKYPGWKYNRSGPMAVELWYPSLRNKASYNVWISSKRDQAAAEQKPNPNERKLSISIMRPVSTHEKTLDPDYQIPFCSLKSGRDAYTEDGTIGLFRRYILDTPGSARLNIIYRPISPISGLYCLKCVEDANCRIVGISRQGIAYDAHYEEERMPNEITQVQSAIDNYLQSKIIRNNHNQY